MMTETAKTAPQKIPLRRRIRRYGLVLLLGLIAGAAAVLSLNGTLSHVGQRSEPTITSDTIVEQIRHVQELVTMEYHYQNVGELKDQKDFRGIPIPFTDRNLLYTFRGTIKAGVDVGQIQTAVDQETKTVALTIPAGKILSHEMPPGEVKPYYEKSGLFSGFTMADYADLLSDRKAVIESEFVQEGYLAEAQREAGETLRTLLSALPGMDEYTLDIQYADTPGQG